MNESKNDLTVEVEINRLYASALKHVEQHDCSAHPYKNAERLVETIQKYKPRRVLEIGTGIGYTAAVMTLTSSSMHIDTMEKDPEHARLARKFLKDNGVGDRISIINDFAETTLPLMDRQYDLIFFDGFQIHYEFLPQYKRLIKTGGILFCANNYLKSKTSDQFFKELEDTKIWKVLDQFGDTIIAQRL